MYGPIDMIPRIIHTHVETSECSDTVRHPRGAQTAVDNVQSIETINGVQRLLARHAQVNAIATRAKEGECRSGKDEEAAAATKLVERGRIAMWRSSHRPGRGPASEKRRSVRSFQLAAARDAREHVHVRSQVVVKIVISCATYVWTTPYPGPYP